MKKILFVFAFFPFFLLSQSIQNIKVEKAAVDINSNLSYRWGNDIIVLDAEPIGGFYGVQRSNGTIYAAINDISATSNLGVIIMFSTNKGDTWQLYPDGITIREKVDNLKMIRSGFDSVYCFFQYGTNVFCWNIERPFINQILSGDYRSFDVAATSTGNLYVVLDSLPNNFVLRYGSIDGGSTWLSRGSISNTSCCPKVSISPEGDTLLINYRGYDLTDTLRAAIRNARYRESTPGTLTSVGSFTEIVPPGEEKHEYRSAFRNREAIFMYTKGPLGSRDIFFRKSTDNGVTFTAEAPLVNSPNRDEYWFDLKPYTGNSGGFNIIYYSDSSSTVPTAFTDQLFFTSNEFGSITVPVPGITVNQFPLEWSSREYPPKIIEMHFSDDDCGILYVANTGSGKKLVWDYKTNIVPVEFTTFSAEVNEGNVILYWTTASETNNSGFEIQRMHNTSRQWSTVGFVNGNGTTIKNMHYTFTDKNTMPGRNSYRLKQNDYNGAFEYSDVINVEVIKAEEFALLQNYPNPFNPATKIEYQLPVSGFTTLKIYDVIGKEISVIINEEKSAGRYEIIFNASQLPGGVYYYTLKSGEFTSTKKLILLK